MASIDEALGARGGSRGRIEARLPRTVGTIGGTTSLGDCLVALAHLITPWRLTEGPSIAAYEEAFAQAVGVRHAVSFWAGRVGLYYLLRALDVGPDDDVLLQAPTHVVVANAIRYTGARPVFVDCDLDTFNIDLEQAARLITPATRVLLVQHTFGNPVDMDRVRELAESRGIVIIEDCVHSLGASFRGRPVGSIGRASFFSTEETKTISSTMGGMVATDDAELATKIKAFQARCAQPAGSQTVRYLVKFLLYHFLTEPHWHRFTRAFYELGGRRHPLPRATTHVELVGERPARYEQRLSNAQAALAERQLRRLGSNIEHRRAVARAYERLLRGHGIKVPNVADGAEPAFVRYPLWVDDRPAAMRAARPRILLGNWFTSVLEEAISPALGGYEAGSCPRAEAAAEHLINLPTHPRVTDGDVEEVVAVLAAKRAPLAQRSD